jgi:hypothetical protein
VENVGAVRNSGMEASLSALVIKSWAVSWSLLVNGAVNHNKLLTLDPGFQQQLLTPTQRQAAGYPLYGYWATRLTYADRNHDGLIEPAEVTVSDSASYIGSSLPTQTGTVSTYVGLFGGAIAVGASFDGAGGYKIYNSNAMYTAYNGVYLREQNVRSAPLWLQARAVAASENRYYACCSSFFEDGSFVRFRELSLTYTVPPRWVHLARLTSLSMTAAVRNLALWTRFTGPDPEVSNPGGGNNPATGSNNDLRQSGTQAVPLTRQWFLRVNVRL